MPKPWPGKVQARKRNPNPNFWVRISSGGVGVLHVKGWGPKSSVCPSKPGKPNFFGRILLGQPGGARKVLEKKVRFLFSFSKSAEKVLRKVPVRNEVPRKVPKKVVWAPRLRRGSIGDGTRSTYFGTFIGTQFWTRHFLKHIFGTFPGRGFGTSL